MSLHDESVLTSRRATLLTYAFLGLFVLLSVGRIVVSDSPPWEVIVGSAVVTTLGAGPIAWLARDRIPAKRREMLKRVLAAVGLLAFTLFLGISLAYGPPFLLMGDAVTVGVVCGGAVALLTERTVIPERYRAERA